MLPCKKIVVIGPESTGKSTLCQGLAAHYHTDWVPEYAREYLLMHGMDYTYSDLLTIARGQLALEEARATALCRKADAGSGRGRNTAGADALPVLFVDTNMYVMKVWSEFVFGKCDPWILDQIEARSYDGYLLCRTDLPWVIDDLREYPDLASREKLYHIYRDCMINQSVPWTEIGGQSAERLSAAILAVERMLVG